MWPCIVTNFSVIKPTRCTNFTNLFCHESLHVSHHVCPSSGVYSLYTQQWCMSYRFVDSFRTGPGCSKSVYKPVWHIPLLSVQWINSWWWTDQLSETCRVSCKNKFVKLVHLVGFITKKKHVLHRTLWRTRCGRGCAPVVRQCSDDENIRQHI